MSRRRRPLVPQAQHGLDRLKAQAARVNEPEQAKYEVAEELNIPLTNGYNGHLTAHDAGRIGGQLGGSMVKELVRMAMERMKSRP
ncbi:MULTISPECIES: alpha/beta-type small acid-soluble spore protein [Brevibacillus]|jgi:small acid-soluble spore protein D (minor alpha/beta-type SASP)|uniref:Alpha/beta-type small acid-soluble spore protein n=1 Tax=Brevibacillus thermoruber TaxID=33942 RepID=A0A9X3Z361_9BACL|nr:MULTISPECIES: alpha/beta-type small acid-soluble spore protein [Brevibacillus]MDA5108497.1 alpha/beta-type small acid-soluble spore protein [Brevibacillus thermoruber]TRY27843.1 alpha/beta-type small acid-soluble spore protein [Brevibacillus sp. LEMMJ03]UYZ12052.1 alpha/beta-type small acid-soluble spore protein [Brevibacillus sp. WF146]